MRNLAVVAAASIFAIVGACSSGDHDDGGGSAASGTSACDPLAAGTTTVGTVLAAGSDPSGTMYIVETASTGDPRIFVSSGSGLVRVANLGSGGNASQSIFTFTSPGSATSGDEELFVDTSRGTTTMAVAPETGTKDFTPPPGATSLAVVDPSSVEEKSAQDLAGVVELVADVSDGTTLVVTAPGQADGTTDFRLFLGVAPTLAQRTLTSYSQSGDGAVGLTFAATGGSASASIPCQTSTFCTTGSTRGTIAEASGAMVTLTVRQPTPTTLDGLSLLCQ